MESIRTMTALSTVEGETVELVGVAEQDGQISVLRLDRPDTRVVVDLATTWPASVLGAAVAVRGRVLRAARFHNETRRLGPWGLTDASWDSIDQTPDSDAIELYDGDRFADVSKRPGAIATLIGEAMDAHAAATVMLIGGPLFIAGLDYWPGSIRGRRVEVRGVLVEEEPGEWWVDQPRWSTVDPEPDVDS